MVLSDTKCQTPTKTNKQTNHTCGAGANQSICAQMGTWTVVHASYDPLVLSFLGDPSVNTGAVEGLAKEVRLTLEPLRAAIASHDTAMAM